MSLEDTSRSAVCPFCGGRASRRGFGGAQCAEDNCRKEISATDFVAATERAAASRAAALQIRAEVARHAPPTVSQGVFQGPTPVVRHG